jgi:tRNA1Val (adenine37-N6)-methyltransferase
MFTYQYQQPPEYHFSLDSIQLAAFVAKELDTLEDLSDLRVLDLCAGCGVIGLQTSWHLKDLRKIDFVEVQDIYSTYFEQNIAIVNRPELQLRWHLLNYDTLLDASWENTYDLIISNPPYFLAGHGMLSPSRFKNHCRFFLDSTFKNFVLAMANSLAWSGKAYFLLRPLPQHGYDMLSEIHKLLNTTSISIKKVTTIRGTDVIQLIKHSS